MAHSHTFACPVFALQNELAAGNSISKWSPRARLGLNLGPSPMHARNVYLVLNLSTGLVSPQFHCRFDDFFETTKHGAPDLVVSNAWQVLAGFERVAAVKTTNQSSTLAQRETPSDTRIPSKSHDELEDLFEFSEDVTSEPTEATRLQNKIPPSQASRTSEGASQTAKNLSAGTSSRGRARTMSRKMADSVSQQEFLATHICTTWPHRLLSKVLRKTFFMTPISNYKKVWATQWLFTLR